MGASAPPSPPAMANEEAAPASPDVEQDLEDHEPERELQLELEEADKSHGHHHYHHNFNSILRELGRANLSIGNRLRSIRADAAFVEEVAAAYGGGGRGAGRPLVANERCGSWYVAPGRKAASAYFKSTDGHFGQWRFSARRLNLHLLALIGARDGCVLVDSTRRGKRMPDALSKTVPIWCCVLNSALFPELAPAGRTQGQDTGRRGEEERRGGCHEVHVPPNVVSASERAQMQARIPEHVAALRALGLDLPALRRSLRKPLRPVWVTQESQLVPMLGEGEDGGGGEVFADYHPVICCTSSRRVVGAEMSEGGYIQGAGDDTENWALGLTPPVFWEHADLLLSTPEPDLPDLVRSLVASHALSSPASAPKEIAPCLFVGALPIAENEHPPSTCTVVIHAKTIDSGSWEKSPLLMEVGIGKHKIASRNLRVALPNICDFIQRYLESTAGEGQATSKRILVACETGKDLSVGIALALLCQFQDGRGGLSPRQGRPDINKSVIKVKLGSIMTKFPDANPSRATLQSVNSYLMG
ncbi:tRNA A64-2'-O-ribosylphosphate transferase [Diatrype stigma]|uniref:tRNA A64-2'-O-ribosylphosphate transferase n=1 Tax=Diatrype stigma TaxID=117547 RepID=A0AAN9UGI7_9PEZI